MTDREETREKAPMVDELARLESNLARVARSAQLSRAARAVLLSTCDREQAFVVVEEVASTCGMGLVHITPAAVRRFDSSRLAWTATDAGDRPPLAMLETARELVTDRQARIVIFEEMVPRLRDGSEHVEARVMLAELLAAADLPAGLMLVLVEGPHAESQLPSMIAAQVVKLQVGYPRAPELSALVRAEAAAVAHEAHVLLDAKRIQLQAPRFADGLVGLTRKSARDLLRDALAPNPSDFDQAVDYLRQQKVARLSRELAMEVLDTTAVERPIGVDNLMRFIEVQKPRISVYGKQRARGVLLIGPPGTGKTMLARALGHVVELPVVVFRISRLMNSLLGETERLFAQAFATLEAMAPCIVFIDEIEKAFGDSTERDGGTMMRVTGSLLSWLSDNLHPNYIVATCNSLTRMGEIGLTMTRSERFDAAFFMDVPNLRARGEILRLLLGEQVKHSAGFADELAGKTDKFSGADLFAVVKHAAANAAHEKRPLQFEHVLKEVSRKQSRAQALYEEFQPLRAWAAKFCEPASDVD